MGNQTQYDKYVLRTDSYVIDLTDVKDLTGLMSELSELGDIETLPNHPGLLVLKLKATIADDIKNTWQHLQEQLGDDIDIYPVIVDERGMKKYALGSIVVRFDESMSDEQIQNWAQEHQLVMIKRNEYVPEQVSFRLHKSSGQFLPEVLKTFSNKTGIHYWLDTLSSYTRE